MNIAEKLVTVANNTPTVADVVNSAKATASGAVVRVDDVLGVEHPLGIQLHSDTMTDFSGVSVKAYGKNLVDYTKATGRNANQKVEIVDGGVLWKAGGDYYFEIPVSLPAGITVVLTATGENAAGEKLLHYTLIYGDNTYSSNTAFGSQRTPDKPVVGMRIYKAKATTALTQDLLVTNIQLEIGSAATDYESYLAPQTATADASGKVAGLTSVSPTMTLLADNNAVTLECTYFPVSAADTVTKYQQLKAEETTLQEHLREYKEESV